jgi:hypothetical protein
MKYVCIKFGYKEWYIWAHHKIYIRKHIWHVFETKPTLQNKIKSKATCIYKFLLEPYYYSAKFENECTLVKKYIIMKIYISFDHQIKKFNEQ